MKYLLRDDQEAWAGRSVVPLERKRDSSEAERAQKWRGPLPGGFREGFRAAAGAWVPPRAAQPRPELSWSSSPSPSPCRPQTQPWVAGRGRPAWEGGKGAGRGKRAGGRKPRPPLPPSPRKSPPGARGKRRGPERSASVEVGGVQVPTHPEGPKPQGNSAGEAAAPGAGRFSWAPKFRLLRSRSGWGTLGGSARSPGPAGTSGTWAIAAPRGADGWARGRGEGGPGAPKGLRHLGRRLPSRPLLRPRGRGKLRRGRGRASAPARPRPGPGPRPPSPSRGAQSCDPRAPLRRRPGLGRHVSVVSGVVGPGSLGWGRGDPGLRLPRPGGPRGGCCPGCPRGWPQFPGHRCAGAAVAEDARPCAAPGPAGRRPGTAGPVLSALPGGPPAPRHPHPPRTRGVGDARSRRQLGLIHSEGLLCPGRPPASTHRVALLPLGELGPPPASPPLLPSPWGLFSYSGSGEVQVEGPGGGGDASSPPVLPPAPRWGDPCWTCTSPASPEPGCGGLQQKPPGQETSLPEGVGSRPHLST